MKILITEQQLKHIIINESMDFFIADYDYADMPTDVFKIANILRSKIFIPYFIKNFTQEEKDFYKKNGTFTIDGPIISSNSSENTINFYPKGMSKEHANAIIDEIKRILPLYSIKIHSIKLETSKILGLDVFRFVLDIPAIKIAPSMNLATGNATILLQLLGYDTEKNISDFENMDMNTLNIDISVSPKELRKRIERAKYYLDEPNDLEDMGQTKQISKNEYSFKIGKANIKRYLERLTEMANYAEKYGYNTIKIG